MKLLRFVAVIATMAICVSSHATKQLVKKGTWTEITSIETLKSSTFCLQNSEGKVLYTPSGWDIHVTSADEFQNSTNVGGYFKIEEYDGHSLIPVYDDLDTRRSTPSWCVGDAYLNTQPANVNEVIFGLSGTNAQRGQDGENLAVWDITYEEGSGFAFHCVGRDIYLGYDAKQARPSAEIVYWTAYAIGMNTEEANTAYAEIKDESIDASLITTMTDAKTAYENNTSSYAAFYAYVDAINAAIKDYNKKNPEAGDDLTSWIKNPDMNDYSYNWTIERNNGNGPTVNTSANGIALEYWSYTPGTGNFDYYQEITGLPAGQYKVSALMFNDQNDTDLAFATGVGVYATSGENTVYGLVTDYADRKGFDAFKRYETDVIMVTDGTLRIGFKNTNEDSTMIARWAVADEFKLTYVAGIDLADLYKTISALMTKCNELKSQKIGASELSTLNSKTKEYEKYESVKDVAKLIEIINELTSAKNAAQTSADNYAEMTNIINMAKELDEDGQAAFAEQAKSVLPDYNSGSVTNFPPNVNGLWNAYSYAFKHQGPGAIYTSLVKLDSWTGRSGYVKEEYCPDSPGSPERFTGTPEDGMAIYQTITGLRNGTYKVVLKGGASTTGERDNFEIKTGTGYSYFFANDFSQNIEVKARMVIEEGDIETAELICGVTDGNLSFGIKNVTKAANWFVCDIVSIEYLSTELLAKDVTLAVSEAKYATFISQVDGALPEGVKAYSLTGIGKDNEIEMEEVDAIYANWPVLLYSETPVEATLNGINKGDNLNTTYGILTGTYTGNSITKGYVLQDLEDGLKFYRVTEETEINVPANRAYIAGSYEAKSLDIDLPDDEVPLAISAVASLASGNAAIYTSNGTRVNSLQKGVNIVKTAEGKTVKVMVK